MDKEKREPEKQRNKAKTTWSNRLCPCSLRDDCRRKALILTGLSLIISFLLTPSFTLYGPHYQLGDIADRNIKAKRDFLIEDKEATSKKREEAIRQAPAVYDVDENVAQHIQDRLEASFQLMRDYLEEGPRLGQTLLTDVPSPSKGFLAEALSSLEFSHSAQQSLMRKKDFESILGVEAPLELFSGLVELRFKRDLQDRITQLLKSAFDQGIVADKAWLTQTQGKMIAISKPGSQEEILIPPPHAYLDLEEARRFIRIQALEQGRDANEMRVIAFLSSQLLQPNLSFNLDQTERRREQAYTSLKPVYIRLMKNEMMVREGQRIGPEELLKLGVHEQGRPDQHPFVVFFTMFLFCGVCIWVVVHVAQRHIPSRPLDVQDFLFLGIMLAFLLILARSGQWLGDMIGDNPSPLCGKAIIYSVPLTAGAMIASIFFGMTISMIFSLLLTLFAGMLFGKEFGLFFYFFLGSLVAAHGVSSCRNRMIPIRAGLMVGAVNTVLIVLSAFLQDQWIFLRILTNIFFGFSGGIFAGILVTGLTPLAENLFHYTTDIKLLELATMDQPLLQELMVQAPGTYHHSIIVGNMVEAAAKSIGANSLLAKVAAYYHDIGKIKKPLYFIENQLDCENRHEKLAPSMSSLILISHVKEGVELAKHHHLGRDIIDIISQHHGKSFISFFYKKALEAREKIKTSKGADLPPINIEDYRYPGPKPQTKEAGLVMLADVVEAACRSLSEPTPARIQGMVNRLINNIFSDGQLEECELTLKDLHHIAKHFNQILTTVHHRRIEYPAITASDGKVRTDATDPGQRESKPDRDRPTANREGGRADLKRLGIH